VLKVSGPDKRASLIVAEAVRLIGHSQQTRLLKPWQQRSIKHCGVRQDLLNDENISNRPFSTK
jgi:hypothetical protein